MKKIILLVQACLLLVVWNSSVFADPDACVGQIQINGGAFNLDGLPTGSATGWADGDTSNCEKSLKQYFSGSINARQCGTPINIKICTAFMGGFCKRWHTIDATKQCPGIPTCPSGQMRCARGCVDQSAPIKILKQFGCKL